MQIIERLFGTKCEECRQKIKSERFSALGPGWLCETCNWKLEERRKEQEAEHRQREIKREHQRDEQRRIEGEQKPSAQPHSVGAVCNKCSGRFEWPDSFKSGPIPIPAHVVDKAIYCPICNKTFCIRCVCGKCPECGNANFSYVSHGDTADASDQTLATSKQAEKERRWKTAASRRGSGNCCECQMPFQVILYGQWTHYDCPRCRGEFCAFCVTPALDAHSTAFAICPVCKFDLKTYLK